MNQIQKLIFLLFFSLGFAVSCSDTEECSKPGSLKKVGKYNMRQDSELTTFMREMETDFKRMKQAIKAGEKPKPGFDYSKILEAHSTEPEVAQSESYRAFAKNFLQVMNSFEKSELDKSTELFETLVGTCLSCHEVHCPGPMVRIKKLY